MPYYAHWDKVLGWKESRRRELPAPGEIQVPHSTSAQEEEGCWQDSTKTGVNEPGFLLPAGESSTLLSPGEKRKGSSVHFKPDKDECSFLVLSQTWGICMFLSFISLLIYLLLVHTKALAVNLWWPLRNPSACLWALVYTIPSLLHGEFLLILQGLAQLPTLWNPFLLPQKG